MPESGQRVGEYVLTELIGRGTFGEVWRGCHAAWSDRVVAIKIPTDADYIRQLQREGFAIHGLKHSNVVRAINSDPSADPPYLVLEYVPGVSLRQLLRNRRLSVDHAIAILRQILAGLAHAHQHGFIHRDLRPENILIHRLASSRGLACPGVVKITDFGLSNSPRSAGSEHSTVLSRSQALQGNVSGTPIYMAPEQAAGQDHDHRADLYACGIILFEMLTGERPAGADLPSSINPQLPQYLDEVFRRACTRLDRRFTSANEMARFLGDEHETPAARQELEPRAASERVDARNSQHAVKPKPVVSSDSGGAAGNTDFTSIRTEQPNVPLTDSSGLLNLPMEPAKPCIASSVNRQRKKPRALSGGVGPVNMQFVLFAVLAIVCTVVIVAQVRTAHALANSGRQALGVVRQYSRMWRLHMHVIAFDGYTAEVNLGRPFQPGTQLQLRYLPHSPRTLTVGPANSTVGILLQKEHGGLDAAFSVVGMLIFARLAVLALRGHARPCHDA